MDQRGRLSTSSSDREWRIGPADWPAAIAAADGPQLVVAGPGTGKTEFLVRRAGHLVESGLARPDQLLLLAFSRRAAADLRRRVEALLARTAARLHASTFHSFCHRLLETFGPPVLGRPAMPSLLTSPEQVALVARLLTEEDPQDWPVPLRPLLSTTGFAEEVADLILRTRERLAPAGEGSSGLLSALPRFVERYDRRLTAEGRIDYGTLLASAVDLLERPQVVQAVADQYRYVLVDEYQDTSPAQARLLELVSAGHHNITVAADPYQSVYSFRGAEVGNIGAFPERFRDGHGHPARRIVLTKSFRVPAEILAAAVRVTAGGELPGSAGPVEPAGHAGRVEAYVFDQSSAEAEWIASEVERLHLEEGLVYRDMAVLLRSKRQLLPELSRALERRHVPHQPPDVRLVDHPAVRIVSDVVRAAVSEAEERAAAGAAAENAAPGGVADETDRAVRRLLLGPLFSLPLGHERELLRSRIRSGARWSEVLAAELPEASELATLLAAPGWATRGSAASGFWSLWTSLPRLERLVLDPSAGDYRAAWSSFAQALERQAHRDLTLDLAGYLALAESEDFEATPLLSFRQEEVDRLTLTTIHQGKGLEFEVVFIADAVEGSFPDLHRSSSLLETAQAGDPAAQRRRRLQEEMRLAYTATTRARRRVVWTATDAGIDEGDRRPSRFMAAVSGVPTIEELGRPPERQGPPVSPLEAEAMLRRLLADPVAPAPRRLAAAAVLGCPPHAPLGNPLRFAFARRPGRDTGVVGPKVVLSPSQADFYRSCPRRYVLERRLRLIDHASKYQLFGSLIHEVLERSERTALDLGTAHATMGQALADLEAVFGGADFGGPVVTEAWKRRGIRLLKRLYADWPGGGAVPVALEHPLSLQIDGTDWVGRADRIERVASGELRVVDYKTSASPPSLDEAAASPQLGFYLLAAQQDEQLTLHGPPSAAEFWYPLVKANRQRYPFQPELLSLVRDQLAALARGIRSETFPPTPGRHCRTCQFKSVCPAWPDGRSAFTR